MKNRVKNSFLAAIVALSTGSSYFVVSAQQSTQEQKEKCDNKKLLTAEEEKDLAQFKGTYSGGRATVKSLFLMAAVILGYNLISAQWTKETTTISMEHGRPSLAYKTVPLDKFDVISIILHKSFFTWLPVLYVANTALNEMIKDTISTLATFTGIVQKAKDRMEQDTKPCTSPNGN